MTREEFIVAAEIAFERLMTPTRGIPFPLMEEPMAEGQWSFKDLAAHFIFWNGLVVRALEALNYGRPFDWSAYANEDELNARSVERARPQSLRRVLGELRLTHSTVTEVLRLIPDDKLLADGSVAGWLIDYVPAHYEHHTPQVAEWAERMRREGKAPEPLNILGGA